MQRVYEYNRYVTTIENVKQTLDQFGVAILPEVLDEKECQQMVDDMWNYLEWLTSDMEVPIRRDVSETWREYRKLYPKHSMLLQHWSIGHCQMQWRLRQNPKIYSIFASIYDISAEDLLSSFDGASFHFPPEVTGLGWYRNVDTSLWMHTDQSYTRNGLECIQSWVTANEVDQGDATLVILEGSHRYHKDFAKQFEVSNKEDWYKLNEQEMTFYMEEKGCAKRHIKCPAGSVVLWDSRTIHMGTEPERGRSLAKQRCVGYICFTPRSLSTVANLKKRKKAFEDGRTTNHWPHKTKLFAKHPRTYGGELPNVRPIPLPELSEIGKKFVGF